MSSAAKLLNQNGVAVVATAITPYEESRRLNRATIENYFEIFLDCPVEECVSRDSQGNYERALRGDLAHFIGVDDPFELPTKPDLTIDSGSLDAEQCLASARSSLAQLLVS